MLVEERKTKGDRDTKVTKELNLKGWDVKNFCSVVICYHCNKPQCVFSQKNGEEYQQSTIFFQ